MAKFLRLSLGRKPEPDDDLDFPDFNFDNPDVKDDRSPVTKAALAAKEGLVGGLTDKENIKKKLKENLPSEYGEVTDLVSGTYNGTKDLIDDSVKAIKPAAKTLAKSVKMFLPPGFSRIEDRLSKIEEWATESNNKGPSKDAQRSQEIDISIGRIFQQQALQEEVKEAKEDAKDKVNKAIEFGRHKDQIAILNSISKATNITSSYTTKVNSEWQKKTLELQYRMLFATRDILEINTKSYEDTKTLLASIQKNTALPEYQKLQNNERFLEQSKNKFIGKSLDTVSGYASRVSENIKKEVKNSIETINGLADMVGTGASMMKMMEEIEGKKSLEERGGKAAGGWLSDKILDFVIGKGGAALRSDPERLEKFSKITNKLGYLLGNKDRLLKSIEDYDEDDPNLLKRYAGKIMRRFSESGNIDTSIRRSNPDDLQGAGVFTNRVSKSITDIIPGYLSKILREIIVLRTGDEQTSPLTFDFKRDRFISEKTLIRLNNRQFKKGNGQVEEKIGPVLKVVETYSELTDAERRQLSRFLIDYSMNGGLFSFKRFSDPKTFSGRLPEELVLKVVNSFESYVSDIGEDSAEYARENKKISLSLNGVGETFRTSAKDAQDLVTNGQEHIARKAGMLTDQGSYNLSDQKDHVASRIRKQEKITRKTQEELHRENMDDTAASNFDADYRQRESIENGNDNNPFGTSDIMAKHDISPAAKEGFIEKLKRLKLFDWKYKKGVEGANPNEELTGPMAQNINNALGSEFAPGGTKVDLVRMNGFLTGATQELNTRIEDIEKNLGTGSAKKIPTDKVEYSIQLTEEIRDNTAKIAAGTLLSLRFLGGIDLGKIDLSKINITDLTKLGKDKLAQGYEAVKDKARWGYDYARDGSLLSALHGIINSALGVGESFSTIGKKAFTGLKDIGSKAYDKVSGAAKWAWEKPLKSTGNWLNNKRKEALESFDVFVSQEDVPRMTYKKIKRGDYVDINDKSRPLLTKSDIELTTGDIIDTKTGQVAIYLGEIDDVYFRQSSLGKFFKAVKRAKDHVVSGFNSVKGMVPIAYRFAWNVAKKSYKTALNWIEGPCDVYVKGEEVPRLFKHAMIAGKYIRASDSKVIERPSQIDGMVYDINQEVVLTNQDFIKGIVNSKGEPFKGPIKKILSGAKSLANFIRKKTIAGVKGGFNALKKVGQGVANVAINGIAGAAGIAGGAFFNGESNDILRDIRDILDARLPGGGGIGYGGVSKTEDGREIQGPAAPNRERSSNNREPIRLNTEAVSDVAAKGKSKLKGLFNKIVGKANEKKEAIKGRVGSWQTMKERENVNKSDHSKELQEVKKYGIKNTFDLIGGMIKKIKDGISGLFNREEGDTGLPDIDLDDGDNDRRDKRNRRNRRGRRGKLGKLKGRGKGLMRGLGRGLGRGLVWGGKKIGGNFGRNLIGLPGYLGKVGRGIGTAASLGGKAVGLAGRALPWAGAAMGAYGTVSNLAEGNYLAAAGNAALTGASLWSGGALLSGAGAILGSISLPVVAGALVVAAAAYGGYKLYKYLTKKKWNDVETVRMLEYGFRGGDEEAFKKVHALEKMLSEIAVVSDSEVNIDTKKVDAAEVYKLFGIDPTSEDNEQLQRKQMFDIWYSQRFMPVFHKWLKAVNKTYGEKDLVKLEGDPEKQYLTLKETMVSNDGWTIPNSPFNLENLNIDVDRISTIRKAVLDVLRKKFKEEPTSKETAAVEGATTEAGKAAADAVADSSLNSSEVSGASETASSKALSILKTAFNYSPVGVLMSGFSKGKEIGLWVGEKIKNAGGITAMFTSPRSFFSSIFSKSISALDSVKMKAYGLTSMETVKIDNLRKLEEIISKDLEFNTDKTISWNGDLMQSSNAARKIFGISENDVPESKALLDYLSKRFIPTFLLFYTGLYNASGKTDFKALVDYSENVPPTVALEIANGLAGLSDVWLVKESPWPGYTLSDSSEIAKSNLDFLAQKAKDKTLPEERATAPKSNVQATSSTPVSSLKPAATPALNSSKNGNNLIAQPEAEDHSQGRSSGGGSSGGQNTGSGAGVGKLTLAGGELATGSGGSKFITANPKVDLVNMNPDFMRLFNGMAEEYGQLTGKSIRVNSAARSMAEQARLYRTLPRGRAAPPGSSLHEFGLALDASPEDLDELDRMGLLRKYGFTRPIGKEPWHIEPVGIISPQLLAAVKKDPNLAKSVIESGIGRGGGGVGDTHRNSSRYFRDWKVHNAIFNSNVAPSQEDKDKMLASLPATGYAAGVENLKNNQISVPSNSGGDGSTIAQKNLDMNLNTESEQKGDLTASAEGGQSNGFMKTSGIEIPKNSFQYNADKLEGLAENNGTGTNWEKLPLSNGASWQAQGPMIMQAAKLVGIDPALAAAVAAKESSFNPTSMAKEAGPKAARGLYQFKPDTFNEMVSKYGSKYGITTRNANIMDPRQSALMGLHYVKQGMGVAGGTSPGWAYLTHFLGQGGNLEKFKSMSDTEYPAATLKGPANNNKFVFFHNGDVSRPRTKAEIIAYCDSEMSRKLAEFKIPLTLNTPSQKPQQSSSPSEGMMTAVYKPDIAPDVNVDNSNPSVRNTNFNTSSGTPSASFDSFNTPSKEQILAASQPPQKGTDPARDVVLLDATNKILTDQLGVLIEVKDLISTIVKNQLEKANATEERVNPNASKHTEPSNVRQRDKPTTMVSSPMINRTRTVV